MILKPDGSILHMSASILHDSVFASFLIPGLILFWVLGVTPVFVFPLLLAQPDWRFLQAINIYKNRYVGWTLSLLLGLGLIIWMDVEVAIIGYSSFIQGLYSGVGLLIVIFTLIPGVMKYYERPHLS